ncbi:MAG: hypothetical protein JWP87_3783 [Labilithrix sp.]|nr:hypothetical protein [Labilithrix sp.]
MKLDRRHFFACCALAASAFAGCGQDHAPGALSSEQATTGVPGPSAGSSPGASGSAVACRTLAVCSDAQALAIAMAVNQGEIDEGNAVVERLTDPDIKAYARQMIDVHTKLRDAIAAVAKNPQSGLFGSMDKNGNDDNGTDRNGKEMNGNDRNGNDDTGKEMNGNDKNGNDDTGKEMNGAIVPQKNLLSQSVQEASRKEIAELGTLKGAELDRAFVSHEALAHLQALALMEHVVVPSISNVNLAAAVASGTPTVKMHAMLALQLQSRMAGACGNTTPSSGNGSGS